MIADTVFLLIIVAFFSCFKSGIKTDKVLSCLIFLFTAFLLGRFFLQSDIAAEQFFSFIWNSSPSGNIMFDIVSNTYNCKFILPFFGLTVLALGYNVIFRNEERRCAFDSVVLFNLAALITMFTSNNLVQLLSGLFLVDVLALLLIHDVENSKCYATFNLIADMILFTVLAVVNCQLESLDMRQILKYDRIGFHKDFVAIAGFFAVCIKFGLIPFQGGIQPLKEIRFHRLQNVLFLSSPAAALILLLKFSLLWQTSIYFKPMLHYICLLSAGWAALCFLLAENLKLKVIYQQILFWALLVFLLDKNGFIWNESFSWLLICQYLATSLLYYVYYQTNRNVSLLKIKNCRLPNWKLKCVAGFGCLTLLLCEINYVYPQIKEQYCLLGWLVIYIIALLQLWHFYIIGKNGETQKNRHSAKMWYWVLTAAAVVYAVFNSQIIFNSFNIMVFIGIVLLLLLPIPGFVYGVYSCKFVQDTDFFGVFYNYFIVKPLQWVGRVLAVIIDRMIIEKTVVGISVFLLNGAIRLFRNMHYNRVWGGIVMLLLLTALWIYAYFAGGTN